MTPTAALREAAARVTMRREGRNRIVSTFDVHRQVWIEHDPTSFWAASSFRLQAVALVALDLLGFQPDEAAHLAQGDGSAENIVRRACRERARKAGKLYADDCRPGGGA